MEKTTTRVKSKMRHDNARHKEQLERMKQLSRAGKCFFCNKNYLSVGAAPVIYQSKHWYIKRNDFPYEGSVHHYLIAPKTHIAQVSKINSGSWLELLNSVKWLENKLGIKGYSLFIRSGDMRYTGATIDHIHFHLIAGGKKGKKTKLSDNILVTLGHKKNKK